MLGYFSTQGVEYKKKILRKKSDIMETKVSDVITINHATFHAYGNGKEGNINYELRERNDR
jgi:hypothetical protein